MEDIAVVKLVESCSNGNLEEIRSLIEKGVDVNQSVQSTGRTPLHEASEKGHLSVVKFLLLMGAEVNVTDNKGITPLELSKVHPQVYSLLKSVGAAAAESNTSSNSNSNNELASTLTSLVNLASESLGSKILFVSEEWFAKAENLLKPGRGIAKPGVFTDRGQWMDGWESARHGSLKRGGKDWCIIQLGAPGFIHGFDIDTNFFTGNFVPEASVDGFFTLNQDATGDDLQNVEWSEILPKTKLSSSSQHFAMASVKKKYTHIRLNIYPDGGIARLKVYGVVAPDWSKIIQSKSVVDLASILNGGKIYAVSDNFYSHQDNALMPARGINMGDGWETRRSRISGNSEWLIIKLGRAGYPKSIEIDTNHFKGNYPNQFYLHGCYGEVGVWKEIIPLTKLQGHTQHFFEKEIIDVGPITHVKVTIFPDGGISRIRINGTVATPLLNQFNEKTISDTLQLKLQPIPLTKADFLRYGDVYTIDESNTNSSNANGQRNIWNINHAVMNADKKQQIYHVHYNKANFPVVVDSLKQHLNSNQTLIPISASKYYVTVALPTKGVHPDLLNLKTFLVNENQIVSIRSGVWIFKVLPLEKDIDFMLVASDADNISEVKTFTLAPNHITIDA